MYFNYHSKVKKALRESELEKFEFVERWNDISPALLLYFKNGEIYPIREHHWDEYLDIISKI